MTGKILISVVIPIYNCDKYLHKCITSVVNQTLKDIEVVLINDASSDNSLNIIDQFSSADSRIVPVNLEDNQGVSTARNSGLDIAKGDYTIFLDADDFWSDDTMLETLYEAAVKNDADIVNFGLRLLDPEGRQLQILADETQVVTLRDNNDWHINYSPVRHLYSRSLIDEFEIRFDPVLVIGEDCLFNTTIYCHASKLVTLKTVYYNYQIRKHSANQAAWSKHKLACTMLWFESAIQIIKNSPAYQHHPRLLQEVILERLRMLTQKLLVRAFAIYNERELLEYIDLCARNLAYIDNDYFDSTIFPTGWPEIPRNTVDMILKKDIAGLRILYSGEIS